MSDLSILLVSAAPDQRNSTAELADLVTELRRRRGVSVATWFLREGDGTPWAGARTVDDLRTATVPATIEKVGLGPVAGIIRGRILRRWWADVDPDVVILDDGLGERLLPDARDGLVVVHRINEQPSPEGGLEAAPTTSADLMLLPEGLARPTGPEPRRTIHTTPRSDFEPARPFVDPEARAIVRRRLGLPAEGLLVVGWGDHPWFNGPDVFVRIVWHLRERHGVDAHGLWAGDDAEGGVAEVVLDEAQRCGLEAHITHRPQSTVDVRLCGDVAVLPYRVEGELKTVHEAAVTGCDVVTFPVWRHADPMLRIVDHLDLEAAAAAVLEGAALDRAERARFATATLDLTPFVDELLDAVRGGA